MVEHSPQILASQEKGTTTTIYYDFNFLKCYLSLHLSLLRNSGRLTWVSLQPQEQSYQFLTVRAVFLCVSKQRYGCQRLGFSTCAQMLMLAIAHEGCADTVRESALKVDSGGKKIPCRTGESNYLRGMPVRRSSN